MGAAHDEGNAHAELVDAGLCAGGIEVAVDRLMRRPVVTEKEDRDFARDVPVGYGPVDGVDDAADLHVHGLGHRSVQLRPRWARGIGERGLQTRKPESSPRHRQIARWEDRKQRSPYACEAQ